MKLASMEGDKGVFVINSMKEDALVTEEGRPEEEGRVGTGD